MAPHLSRTPDEVIPERRPLFATGPYVASLEEDAGSGREGARIVRCRSKRSKTVFSSVFTVPRIGYNLRKYNREAHARPHQGGISIFALARCPLWDGPSLTTRIDGSRRTPLCRQRSRRRREDQPKRPARKALEAERLIEQCRSIVLRVDDDRDHRYRLPRSDDPPDGISE